MQFVVAPVAFVSSSRQRAADDYWGDEQARITLADAVPTEALTGLAAFSHVEIIFCFHRVEESGIVTGVRHPRNNSAWPAVGIFAQRGKNRPNRLGTTLCRLVAVQDRSLLVTGLDAIDGTPVLDIKPVMAEFLPREPISQPQWSRELMTHYWQTKQGKY
jgi:tRNA-Thr(GGU) m(6)t(6)A37 methyltransferase TsaA